MGRRWILFAPLVIMGIVLFTILGGGIVMWLWNWLLPPLFGWPKLTFWQAWAMLALCRILFGGLGLHSRGGSSMGRRMKERIRERMAERWEAMTPEERERFRQGMGAHFGFGGAKGERQGQVM